MRRLAWRYIEKERMLRDNLNGKLTPEKRLMDKYGQISQLSLNAFNCVWVMTHAIEAAQSFDTTVVRDYWENMEYVDTLYGKGKMGGKETYGINHAVGHPCPIHALNKGKVEFLAWMDIQMP